MRSRARTVAAQDSERRRIERDIHDGVQQEVGALIAKPRLARNRLGRGESPDRLLAELQGEAGELLSTCVSSPTASTRRSSATAASSPRWRHVLVGFPST